MTQTGAEGNPRVLIDALRRQLGAELIETHISWVLLAGGQAWKIKRPVNLGFLDFSSLQQRQHFCQEELRLNRVYAPSVYQGLVAITGTPGAPRLGGSGPPIEYALQMRRFPPRALLSEKLADGLLLPGHIDALAQRVAALHVQAAVAPPASAWGSAERVAGDARTVLARLQAQGADVADLQRWLDAQIPLLTPLWQRRPLEGWVRECHGDLHLRNAVALADGVTAFDAIEFDPALRWIDVQADIAFMAMDLHAHRKSDLAWRFVNTWLEATGDFEGMALHRFYVGYRALVRAMVGRLHAEVAAEPSADDYLALARRVALAPGQPRLLVTHGFSGSGKTHLTQRLLEAAGALRLRSDVERKRAHGLGALETSAGRVPGGIYGPRATQRTFERLEQAARTLLRAGWPVIVDAACLRHAERERFATLAGELALPFTLLDCQASTDTLRERVRARLQRGDDASEANEAVLVFQLDIHEPLTTAEQARAIVCRTEGELDVAAIAAQWQAKRV